MMFPARWRLWLAAGVWLAGPAAAQEPAGPPRAVVIGEEGRGERRWSLHFGGGVTPVVGALGERLEGGSHFAMGGGYRFTPRFGLVLEFLDNNLGVEESVLREMGVPDGDARVWSVTLNPVWRFRVAGPVGGYLIGGGGFYRRTIEFTRPGGVAAVPVFDPWWGWDGTLLVPVEEIVGSHRDDAGGANAGLGLTVDLGGTGLQFFTEARYHHLFTDGRDTQLLPVTFGFRF